MNASHPLNLNPAKDLHKSPPESTPTPMQQNELKCNTEKNPLNDKQLAAIELLALGKSFGATAEELKLNRGTIYRWRQEEPFKTALENRRTEIWAAAGDRLKDLVHASLEVMADMMTHPYDGARIRAASTILKLMHPATTTNG